MKWLLGALSAFVIFGCLSVLAELGKPEETISKEVGFPGLPLEQPRVVDFEAFDGETDDPVGFRNASYWNGYVTGATGNRERLDQYRDWLLMAALSATDLDPDAINKVLFDLPPIRRGVLTAVASFEYGETRSRVIGEGEVLALIPARSEPERTEDLAHVADEHRKNLGEIPRTIDVVEYRIEPGAETATLTRVRSVPGTSLFTEAAGYVEADVVDLPGFTAFMGRINDVTYVKRIPGGLRLGGRMLRGYRGIGVEEVAAIWQTERAQRTGTARETGTGFSLDPELEFYQLYLKSPGIERFLAKLNEAGPNGRSPVTQDEIEAISRGFLSHDAQPYLTVTDKLCAIQTVPKRCSQVLRDLLLQNRHQKARYDGDLRGTEVGMVFFYTDLLMKLWGLDFQYSNPARRIEGFPNRLEMKVAAVYRDEVDRFPETRLWLGSLDQGFQIGPDRQEILLSRIGTRVFAVPHDFFSNSDVSDVVEPHVYLRVLIKWWNAHFEEVARFEQEYQRLNELIKWTQIIGWLNGDSEGDRASFLQNVTVTHDRYFPTWARRNHTLTYSNWDAIGFLPRGTTPDSTEALVMLSSRQHDHFGKPIAWTGGVSGARAEQIASRVGLRRELGALSRRAGLEYGSSEPSLLTTLEKVEYRFEEVAGRFETVASAPTTQRLRGLTGELRATPITRSVSRGGSETVLKAMTGDAPIGDLHIARSSRGFRIAWASREVDASHAIARRVSMAEFPGEALRADPRVDQVLELPGGDEFLVKAKGANGWTQMKVSPTESSDLTEGYASRISGFGPDARSIDVAFRTEQEVTTLIPRAGFIEVAPPTPGAATRIRFLSDASPGGTEVRLQFEGRPIAASVDPRSGAVLARLEDLPQPLLSRPGSLLDLAVHPPAQPDEFFQVRGALERGDGETLARAIAADPDGARTALSQLRSRQIAHYEELIKSGRFEEATAELRVMLAEYGDVPELLLRDALAQLERGELGRAITLAETGARGRIQGLDGFFEEIRYRIALGGSAGKENLEAVGNYVKWSQKAGKTRKPGLGAMRLEQAGNRVTLRFETDRLSTQAATWAEVAEHPDALVYIQDTPGLNGIDFSPTSQSSVEALIAAGEIDIRRAAQSPLAEYRPSVLFEKETGTRFRIHESRGALTNAGFAVVPLPSCEEHDSEDRSSAEKSSSPQDCYIFIVVVPTRKA
jgi:hypothetical protein